MPSSYTVNLGIEKIATGEQSGTWGDTTNINFDIIDQAVNGAVSVTLASAGSSGAPNTLAITDGATSNGRNKFIEFTDGGDLGATAYVQLTPNDAEKIVFIRNSLSGSRSVILFQGTYDAARDLEVPAGVDMIVKFQGGGTVSTVENVMQRLQTETLSVTGNADVGAGLDVTGNITVTGTVDGRDVAADGTKLDGIEAGADVTDTANVTAAIGQSVGTSASPSFAGLTVDTSTLHVDSANNRVGVGTTSPATTLEVATGHARADVGTNDGDVTVGGRAIDMAGFEVVSTSGRSGFVNRIANDFASVGNNSGFQHLYPFSNGGDAYAFRAAVGTTLSDTFWVKQQGTAYFSSNLGIGTASPSEKLDVSGNAKVSGDLTVDTSTLHVDSANNRVGIGTASPSDKLVVAGTARIGTGGSSADMKLDGAATPAVTVGGSTTASIISNFGSGGGGWHVGIEVPSNDANDGFYIATDANNDGTVDTLAMKVKADGSVGIKTTSPAGDFDVNGTVFFPAVSTTALAANARIAPVGGEVLRSTSSIRYKTDVENADAALSEAAVYDSRPVWYRSLAEADPGEWSFWGFIAEELHEIDPRLVDYAEDENGELRPDGVQYDRFVVHLVNVAQQQKARIDDLEARLAALEAKL